MKAKVVKLAASLVEDLNSFVFKSQRAESDVENIRKNPMMLQNETQVNSTTLALQQFRKEEENKEAAAEAAKLRCRLCFKEIAPTRRCFGHGGGGGGGGGEGSSSDNTSEGTSGKGDDKTQIITTDLLVEETENLPSEFSSMDGGERIDTDSQSNAERFDPEIIAELVAKGLLVISNDRESMTLTIKLQCDPNSLSKEQKEELKKYINAIITEFNEFKEQHQLSDDCINVIQDEEGNIVSLRISLPTLKLYDEFIQKLANNLLTISNPKLHMKDEHEETKHFSPTPLSMESKPSIKSKDNVHDELKQNKDIATKASKDEEQELFNPSPFSMTPW